MRPREYGQKPMPGTVERGSERATVTGKTTINAVLFLASVCFAVGIIAPMLTLKKLMLVSNTFSVLSGTLTLMSEGEYLLFVVIFGFSVVLPSLKIILLFMIWNSNTLRDEPAPRYLAWFAALGKWSMLDVFVVAVLLASVKLGALASVEIHYGLYAFATSVVLIMIATGHIKRIFEHQVHTISHKQTT